MRVSRFIIFSHHKINPLPIAPMQGHLTRLKIKTTDMHDKYINNYMKNKMEAFTINRVQHILMDDFRGIVVKSLILLSVLYRLAITSIPSFLHTSVF